MGCSIYVAKTKALISFAITAKLICVFVYAYAKSRFSHDEAQIRQNISACAPCHYDTCSCNKTAVFIDCKK